MITHQLAEELQNTKAKGRSLYGLICGEERSVRARITQASQALVSLVLTRQSAQREMGLIFQTINRLHENIYLLVRDYNDTELGLFEREGRLIWEEGGEQMKILTADMGGPARETLMIESIQNCLDTFRKDLNYTMTQMTNAQYELKETESSEAANQFLEQLFSYEKNNFQNRIQNIERDIREIKETRSKISEVLAQKQTALHSIRKKIDMRLTELHSIKRMILPL